MVSTPAGRKVVSRFDSRPSTDEDNGEVVRTIIDCNEKSRQYILKISKIIPKNVTEKVLKFNQVIVIDVLKFYLYLVLFCIRCWCMFFLYPVLYP